MIDMHLSMHNWMRSEPIEVTVERLARFGYGSIEIKGEPDQYDTTDVRKLLADNGLKCWGGVTLTLGERNLCAKDEKQRAASVDYVKGCVTMVKELEGTEITIVPSTVGKIVPDGTPEEEWSWCVESLKQIHEHASAAGIVMAIEPLNRFETHFVTRGEQALALADAVSPDVGVCLDCFHMNIEEVDLLETIRTIGPRLKDFHVADNNRMACGMGALDWPAIVGALDDIGYDGALTVEFVAPVDRTPANRYPDAVETNPVDISPEELQFIIDHGSSLLSESFYSMLVEKCATTLLPLIQ
jgi:sugar phosphate isomerase/epimerase